VRGKPVSEEPSFTTSRATAAKSADDGRAKGRCHELHNRCCGASDSSTIIRTVIVAKARRTQQQIRSDDPAGWWRDPVAWVITALAALLLLVNLGGRALWEDEAETALLGRSILAHGKPVASNGINVISQEAGREFGSDYVWRWSPWVQFYLGAAGLKMFGDSALGARLPFALLAIPVIPLVYLIGRRAFGSILVARLAALALATSPWFLLQSRQARWEAPAYLLTCIVLLAVFEMERSIAWPVVIAAAGAALFYTNYFVAVCLLVSIAAASPMLRRDRDFLIRLACGLAGAAALSIPGVIFFHVLGKTGGGQLSALKQFWLYAVQFVTFLAPLPLVIIALFNDRRPATRFVLATVTALCIILAFAPWSMFRYLTIAFPIAALVSGVALAWLMARSRVAGWIGVALLVCTSILHQLPLGYMQVEGTEIAQPSISPIASYVQEMISPPRDADVAVVEYLRAHASPGDTVLASYGDLLLQFYTRLHVTGGLEGHLPPPSDPEWIVLRPYYVSPEPGKDFELLKAMDRTIDLRQYDVATTVPDPILSGNPDPMFHLFREDPTAKPLRLLRHR